MRRKMCGLEEAIGLIANKLSMPELKDLMKERKATPILVPTGMLLGRKWPLHQRQTVMPHQPGR
jgi:hypothetical protein